MPRTCESPDNERADGNNFHHHECALGSTSALDPQAVDNSEESQSSCAHHPVSRAPTCEVEDVTREGYRNGRHAPGLNHQQENPSVQKCDGRMISLAQVRILTTHSRQGSGEFGPDQSTP